MSNDSHALSVARRRKHRKNWQRLIVVLVLILVALVATVLVLKALDSQDQPSETTPAVTELTLPNSIQLLSPSLAAGEDFQPQWLASGLEGTGITVELAQPLTLAEGWQAVTLRFTDGTAACTQTTQVYGFALNKTLTLESEAGVLPTIRDYVPDEAVDARLEGAEAVLTPGAHTLTVVCGSASYEVACLLTERNAPQATGLWITAPAGTVPDPATLVTDIVDESPVTVTYQETPELLVVDSIQKVTVILTDAFGNTATVECTIEVTANENAPRFEGIEKLWVKKGGSVSYKSGVTATDPQDGAVSFQVDNSAVDIATVGVYTVYYSATDSDGNTTVVTRKVEVYEASPETVDEYVQKVLDKIIREDMTRDEKIYAVYYYTCHHVYYVGSSDKSSLAAAAYEGFSTGCGDCYTYYAMNRLLLDALGIENLEVTRTGGTSHHWWNLVQFEDGRYYHVDSCPVAVTVAGVNQSKMTESDLQTYTNDPGVVNRRPNFYVYDHDLPEYEGLDIVP